MIFPSYNVTFRKGAEDWIVACGEIRNDTIKDYRLAFFRIIVYGKSHTLGSGVIKIPGFRGKSTRYFEILIEGISYKLIPSIVRHEIVLESAA